MSGASDFLIGIQVVSDAAEAAVQLDSLSAANDRLVASSKAAAASADTATASYDKMAASATAAADASGAGAAALDTTTASTRVAASSTAAAGAKAEAAGASAFAAGGKFSKFGRDVAIGGAVAAIAMIKMGGDFENATTQLVTGAGESEKNLEMVRQGILGLSGTVAQSPKDLAAGMYLIESAGYHGAKGLDVLKASAEGAAVGGAQMSDVSNALTTALTDYQIPASQANQVTSAMIQTVASGKMHLGDLATSMGKVFPVASALGVNFQDVAGAMATMTNQGLSARFAAMHLQNTFLALSAPSSSASKAMADVGLTSQQIKDALDGPKGLSGALELIESHVGSKFPQSSVAYVSAMKDILGGSTGYSTSLMLSGSHTAAFNSAVDSIGSRLHGSGKEVQGFSKVQSDFNFQMDKAKDGAKALGTSIGMDLLPYAKDGLKAFEGFAGYLEHNKDAAIALAAVVGGVLATAVGVYAYNSVVKLTTGVKNMFGSASNLASKLTGGRVGSSSGGLSGLGSEEAGAQMSGAADIMMTAADTMMEAASMQAESGLGGGLGKSEGQLGKLSSEEQALTDESKYGWGLGKVAPEAGMASEGAMGAESIAGTVGGEGVTFGATTIGAEAAGGGLMAGAGTVAAVAAPLAVGIIGTQIYNGTIEKSLSKRIGAQQAAGIGDAITGAGIGAAVGSVIPGVGTVVGGAVGAGVGFAVGERGHIENAAKSIARGGEKFAQGAAGFLGSLTGTFTKALTGGGVGKGGSVNLAGLAGGFKQLESGFKQSESRTQATLNRLGSQVEHGAEHGTMAALNREIPRITAALAHQRANVTVHATFTGITNSHELASEVSTLIRQNSFVNGGTGRSVR